MLAAALVLAALAAVLHVAIFFMESFFWTTPKVRKTFGLDTAEANATRAMAFNQGFYNLFLAIVTAVGIGLDVAGRQAAGTALLLAGTGSMALAAIVLVASDRSKLAAALKQGLLPLASLLCTLAVLAS